MAQSRKSIYSLGGPEYLPDPRVQEAQNWLQLGQAGAAQRMARDAQIASAQAGLRSAAIRAAAQQGDADLKRQLAQLEADARLSEAAMREQGWTAREETRQAGDDRRQTGRDSAAWERALLEAGLADRREAAQAARAADQQDRIDARSDRGDYLSAIKAAPTAEDLIDADLRRDAWAERTERSIDMSDPRKAREQLAAMAGHPGYPALRERLQPAYDEMRTGSDWDWSGAPGRALGLAANPSRALGIAQQNATPSGYLSALVSELFQPQESYPGLEPLPEPTPGVTREALVQEFRQGLGGY